MGRFETTAATYAARREPYPAAFFAETARALKLTGQEALIDLGTGPGLLALGFRPYVGSVLGVDPEPLMVEAAREAATVARVAFSVVLGRAEDIGPERGRFDVVSIGRALHWMEREPLLAAFDRVLAPGARIAICGSRSSAENPWRPEFERVMRAWGARSAQHREFREHFFDGTRFVRIADVTTPHRHPITVEALVERALTRSSTSPAMLGDRVEAFKTELRDALRPFFSSPQGVETIEATASLFAAG